MKQRLAKATRWTLAVLLALGVGMLIAWSASYTAVAETAPPPAQEEMADEGGSSWTAEDCAACHEDQVAEFGANPHSVLDSLGWADQAGAGFSCAACHSGIDRHMEEGGGVGTIFAFGDTEAAMDKAQVCLTCHADTHPQFLRSAHAMAAVSCTDCHSVHDLAKGKALRAGTTTCKGCHEDVFTQFAFNERHRLKEGILDCASCHNPHEPATRAMLGGFKQEACMDCHADKGGPYVFEHGAQRVEGCVACHSPHGSPNRHLLKHQNVAELCFSCHAVVPGFHSRFTLETQCTNCHSTIHGSNFHPAFLK